MVWWFALSSVVVLWDAGYALLRPWSMENGSLHALWTPYKLYGEIDYIYGWPAFLAHDGFCSAQSAMNLVETALNVYFLLLHSRGDTRRAMLVGYTSQIMTSSKTLLYWLNEYFSGFAHIGHNGWAQLVALWMVPNGLWLVIPTIIAVHFGRALDVVGSKPVRKRA